jgi:dCMP deaminase
MQQINSSIWNKKVVYHNGYRDDSGIQFLIKAGVEVEHIPVLEE